MQVQLIVSNKSQKGTVIPVAVPAFNIGRAEDCHLRSDSSRISRQHCVICTHDDTVTISDLDSETGTYVNGKRIAALHELNDGDELTVGRHSFVVSMKAGVTQPATSEDDFFALISDSADRHVSETEHEKRITEESTIEFLSPGTVDEPRIQVIEHRKSPKTLLNQRTTSEKSTTTRRYVTIWGITLAVLCLLGIGGVWLMGGATNSYGAVHIVGTLTLDGEPVAGASVILSPRDRDAGHVAGGITDSRGRFTVTTGTAPMVNGAVPGVYDVTFSKIEIENASLALQTSSLPPSGRQPNQPNQRQPERRYVIPQKYGDSKTSGLEPITVEATGNSFSFALTSVAAAPPSTPLQTPTRPLEAEPTRSPQQEVATAREQGLQRQLRDAETRERQLQQDVDAAKESNSRLEQRLQEANARIRELENRPTVNARIQELERERDAQQSRADQLAKDVSDLREENRNLRTIAFPNSPR